MASIPQKNNYQRKLKTREELSQIIGRRPREQSVVMCHGVFDLVHPGHLQHLMYAKSKADILVTTLTCDAHISKAAYRPFVPQDLRAMNLAALEVVDYVLIDENETPIENIRYLQPDYFAKGYEYSQGEPNPRTQEEIDTLASYGAEIIFTPGDVVYSSSAFIESVPPNLSVEKLAALMKHENITLDVLRSALRYFQGVRVHVTGDTIVDSYVYCTLIGSGTSKTPTLSVRHERQVDFIGGAAVVTKHLRSAGAVVQFSTVLGDDPMKEFVLAELAEAGVDCQAQVDPSRVTTQKNAYIADEYRLVKVDKVDNRPVSAAIVQRMRDSLAASDADAFVFSDYRHGIFNRRIIPQLTEVLPKGPLRVADSQVASRWGNILDFCGFDLITPNEKEARFALGDQDSVIRPLALDLFKRAQCKTLVLKLGEQGILTYRAPNNESGSFFSIDSFAGKVVDPVGAGDALLAYTTLALTTTRSEVVASILGSMAAAVACEHEGNLPVTPEQVLSKLDVIENHAHLA